jgi:thiamine monophosphate synthase
MVKLEINKTLTDDQFVLEQPSGADVVHLGQSDSSSAKTADSQSK